MLGLHLAVAHFIFSYLKEKKTSQNPILSASVSLKTPWPGAFATLLIQPCSKHRHTPMSVPALQVANFVVWVLNLHNQYQKEHFETLRVPISHTFDFIVLVFNFIVTSFFFLLKNKEYLVEWRLKRSITWISVTLGQYH